MSAVAAEELSSRLSRLEAVDEVRTTLFQYCRAADRCDLAMMQDCYHPGAIDDHGFYSGDAKEFCVFVIEKLSQLELSFHSLGNICVSWDGDQIIAESQYIVVHRIKNFLGFTDFVHRGRYFDRFERRDNRWRISKRMICQDGEHWLATANLRLFMRTSPNLPIAGAQNRTDPHYLGANFDTAMRQRPTLERIWNGFRRLAIVPVGIVRVLTIIPNLFFDRGPNPRT